MDPFESKKIHSGTTGLIDNWREKLTPPPSTVSPQPRSFALHASVTPDRQQSPSSSLFATTPAPLSVRSIPSLSLLSLTTLASRWRIRAPSSYFRRSALTGKRFTPVSRTFLTTFALAFATLLSESLSGMSSIPRHHGRIPISRQFNLHIIKSFQHIPLACDAMMLCIIR